MMLDRRALLTIAAALSLPSNIARAADVKDAAGRMIAAPASVARVFPAGPPAAIMLYTLAPDLLLGWPRANRLEEREFLLPDVGARPELGRLTGRGNTANLEVVLALKPDLIIDIGSTTQTYVDLADRVQAQTNIPYALLDGRFSATAETYRLLGELTGRRERAKILADWCERSLATIRARIDSIPANERPRVYYARGPRGLETGLGGSINVETIEFLGARNVAGETRGGLVNVSLEQILLWNPDVVVAMDIGFAAGVRGDSSWAGVKAVRDNRVHLSPKLPFGWVDFPPSVNRMIGLWWLAKILYPQQFPEDIKTLARDFYTLFYQVTPTEAQLARVLEGRD